MSRLYLITGFLGAGKTTFLKQFMKQFSSERMHIIVNEFGKEGIDGELLSELGIALDEINNGSIFCSCGWINLRMYCSRYYRRSRM